MKKGLDENFKKNPLRVYFIHSISECANPFSILPKKGIKDLLDPPSNPCTTLLRISSYQSLIRKGTASAAGFKEKSVNVAKNLAEYINMDDAGHFKYGLGFITSHVSHVMFMS